MMKKMKSSQVILGQSRKGCGLLQIQLQNYRRRHPESQFHSCREPCTLEKKTIETTRMKNSTRWSSRNNLQTSIPSDRRRMQKAKLVVAKVEEQQEGTSLHLLDDDSTV
mmetsp:Transcript_21096/g.52319  ORF Transcript_21096/g.52319 Transcript_21096/m.52319 type:complete len:109 (+) Transcript_21096:3138-3464(+)